MKAAMNPTALPGVAVLEQSPIIIEKLVGLASEEQLRWKPSMERWSISEVLAHLADVEVTGFRERIERMIESDTPHLASYDQNAQYQAGRYSSGSAREHLKVFCHERDRSLSWLRYLPESILARKGQHAAFGAITVAQLMNEWAFHDLGHIRQIAELFRSRAFFSAMGPFQKGYTIKP
ncbi:MAG TPA: DinB family protein [Candidatus Acidoferrales bacterium]|nr:DinB family protein [Candidatus Acidoferrales bacterium]